LSSLYLDFVPSHNSTVAAGGKAVEAPVLLGGAAATKADRKSHAKTPRRNEIRLGGQAEAPAPLGDGFDEANFWIRYPFFSIT
jgi:hypothetical protein